MSSLAVYGANLAVIALTAAKSAGDALLSNIELGIDGEVPGVSEIAIQDFLDVIPASYRTEVQTLLAPTLLAARTQIDKTVIDRINTGIAIAQAALDNRIAALTAVVSAGAAAAQVPTVRGT